MSLQFTCSNIKDKIYVVLMFPTSFDLNNIVDYLTGVC